jgi:TolB-like protein
MTLSQVSGVRRLFRFGLFELSEREGELRKQDTPCTRLQEQPLRVLVELLANAGQIVTREELRQRLWPANTYVDFDVGLNTAIRKLRQALGDDADRPRFIETFARRGYRFIEPVTEVPSEAVMVPAQQEPRAIASIAVLAFANLGGDVDTHYFSDGLAEDLISAFSRLKGLKVASRTSAFRFRDRTVDIREVGRELNVEAVLEGSVRRLADRVRITVQLVNVADGYQLWSERFDREFKDILAIQDEITAAIVRALAPSLAHQQSALSRRNSQNVRSYDLYLKGRHFWHQRAEGSMRAGLECFRAAVDLDPEYAVAHCGVADSLSILAAHGYMSIKEARSRAETAVTRALTLDRTLAETHFSAGLATSVFGRRLSDAEAHFRRGLEIEPQTSVLYAFLSLTLATQHHFVQAIQCGRKAIELDPQSPFVQGVSALALQCSRVHEEALAASARALELQPNFVHGLWSRNMASCALGRWAEAIDAGEALVAVSRRSSVFLGQLALTYGMSGRQEQARALRDEVLQRAQTGEYIGPSSLLAMHVGLNELDRAQADLLAYLEDGGNGWHLEISMGPFLDRLADQPGFAELFRRMERSATGAGTVASPV